MSKTRTFTQTDWYGLAGAEYFSDDSSPIIREFYSAASNWFGVADKNGIAVYQSWDGEDAFHEVEYRWSANDTWTADMAEVILNGLPDRLNRSLLERLGFDRESIS